jgi:hypothetical protein
MKMYATRVAAMLALAGLMTTSRGLAEDKPAAGGAKAGEPNMEEMMKKQQEYSTPGAGHKVLDPLVGEWEVQARFWMAGPDGPATESKGTAKTQWTLGGRYLQEDFSGEMMQQPFQGRGVTAYDNFKKKYISTWTDTMSTGIFISEGSADEGGKVLTFQGKMDEPATGQKDKPTKYIIRILSPDKHVMEMHDLTLGEKSKVFEMTYTRKS